MFRGRCSLREGFGVYLLSLRFSVASVVNILSTFGARLTALISFSHVSHGLHPWLCYHGLSVL